MASSRGEASPEATPTTHANLRQLAGLIRRPRTPLRRKSSAGAPSTRARRLPNTLTIDSRVTPRSRRPLESTSGNQSNPITPHTIRALQQRRTTPGPNGRKSARVQRETPRDALRTLSRVLARERAPSKPLPIDRFAEELGPSGDEEDEDELSLEQPTASEAIDLGENNEDSFDALPPRFSIPIGDEEQTIRSVELPRRAREMEDPSQGFMGDIMSGNPAIDATPVRLLDESEMVLSDGVMPLHEDNPIDECSRLEGQIEGGGDTGDLRKLMFQMKGPYQPNVDERELIHPRADAYLPFILDIPNFEPRQSIDVSTGTQSHTKEIAPSPAAADDYLDEDPLQSVHFKSPVSAALAQVNKRTRSLRSKKPKVLEYSRHGIAYSKLPLRITKRIAMTLPRPSTRGRSKLKKETVEAIAAAGEKFFEQLGGDLATFAKHGKRKTIDDADVVAVMRRQKHISLSASAFSLAQSYLPRELVHGLRLPPLEGVLRRINTLPIEEPTSIDEDIL